MTSFKTSNKSWLFTFILVLYIYFSFFLHWPFPLFKSCNFICSRQEPKHLPAAGISEDNTRGWDIVRKIKHLAEKRSFGQMRNFEPRALSSDIPASQKRVYLFYDPMINFSISNMLGEEEKQKHVVSARANDENKHIDWLIFFCYYWNCDWTRAWQAVVSNELSQHPIDQKSKKERFLQSFSRG